MLKSISFVLLHCSQVKSSVLEVLWVFADRARFAKGSLGCICMENHCINTFNTVLVFDFYIQWDGPGNAFLATFWSIQLHCWTDFSDSGLVLLICIHRFSFSSKNYQLISWRISVNKEIDGIFSSEQPLHLFVLLISTWDAPPVVDFPSLCTPLPHLTSLKIRRINGSGPLHPLLTLSSAPKLRG